MRAFFVAFLLFLIVGCASTTTTSIPLNPENDKEAAVYIIRERVAPTALGLEVHVDGKQAATLANQSFCAFSLSAGEHGLFFQWPAGSLQPDTFETKLNLRGRETRYFLVAKDDIVQPSALLGPAIVGGVMLGQLMSKQLRLLELSPDAAKVMIVRMQTRPQ